MACRWRRRGVSWRLVRAPCPFQWSQPASGVNGSFAAISWNRTDKRSNSGCPTCNQHLARSTMKCGYHSSNTSANWNEPSRLFYFLPPSFSSRHICWRKVNSLKFCFKKYIQDRRRRCWTASDDPSGPSYRAMSCWLTRWWITKTPLVPLTVIHRTT